MHFQLSGLSLCTFVSIVWCEVLSNKVKEAQPFLGHYLIEDTCQFQLCGPKYSGEWGSEPPRAGSCSGDCSLLATTLNTNKFQKEFLWNSCAQMCGRKFPAEQNPEYKNRFLCMESCYNSYNLVSPHHDIARYCLQAACNIKDTSPNFHQIDCFESCAKHVSSSLPEYTWKVWARAISSSCTTANSTNTTLQSRLKCGDRVVWEYISKDQKKAEEKHSHLCLESLCNSELKCGVSCLNHIHDIQLQERAEWVECSTSQQCREYRDWPARQGCADSCLLVREQKREKERLNLLRTESQSQQQLQYSSSAANPVVHTAVLLAAVHLALRTLSHYLPLYV